jgi:hypothetical protein
MGFLLIQPSQSSVRKMSLKNYLKYGQNPYYLYNNGDRSKSRGIHRTIAGLFSYVDLFERVLPVSIVVRFRRKLSWTTMDVHGSKKCPCPQG